MIENPYEIDGLPEETVRELIDEMETERIEGECRELQEKIDKRAALLSEIETKLRLSRAASDSDLDYTQDALEALLELVKSEL